MFIAETQNLSSNFNSQDVYFLGHDEGELRSIQDIFLAEGFDCHSFDVTKVKEASEAENSKNTTKNKSMLLINSAMFEFLQMDIYNQEIIPNHFVFSYGEDLNEEDKNLLNERSLVGNLSLPIVTEDIKLMVGICEQRVHYEEVINGINKKHEALEKISSLGRFTGSLVHDLNNYNTICMTAFDGLKLVNKRNYQDEKLDFLVSKGLKGCKMINSISMKYRRFMFVSENQEKQHYELNHIVSEALTFNEKGLNQHSITYKIEIPRSIHLLCLDTTLIQVLVNLISNSIFEIKKQKAPWISIKYRSKKTGGYLYIIDSGNGIAKEIQEKIFDPLFSTKSQTEGTGFGLNFCMKELKNMGMNLRYIESDNTAFAIEIPLNLLKLNS